MAGRTITDLPPDNPLGAKVFKWSEDFRLSRAAFPPERELRRLTTSFLEAREVGKVGHIRKEAQPLLEFLSDSYGLYGPKISVLSAPRPIRLVEGCASELFGSYSVLSEHIRLWMRTARKAQVTSGRSLLNTLLHEFCHHWDLMVWKDAVDLKSLGYKQTGPIELIELLRSFSPHTRGFYARIDELYYKALGISKIQRKPLLWRGIESGRYVRIWNVPAIGKAREEDPETKKSKSGSKMTHYRQKN